MELTSKSNKECLHGLLYVLVTGIAWEMLPPCWPSYKTIQRRLKHWLQLDVFRTAWTQLAQKYEQFQGINWDKILLDGSKKPAKKGRTDGAISGRSCQVRHCLAVRSGFKRVAGFLKLYFPRS
jgi:transposase